MTNVIRTSRLERSGLNKLDRWIPYGFVLPHLTMFTMFFIVPIIFALVISFTNWGIVGDFDWVGLHNYRKAMKSHSFWQSVRVTLTYTALIVPACAAAGLGMALFVNRKLLGSTFTRIVFFSPWVISSSVVGLVWLWMYQPGHHGIFNYYLGTQITWLSKYPMLAVAVTTVWWQSGFGMVIYLAALQDIPQQLYDAAHIDGANSWQRFRYVTFPMMTAATSFVLVIYTIVAMRSFDLFYLMTQGGPAGATTTMVLRMWETAFENFMMGYASAVSFMLFLLIFVVAVIQFKFIRQRTDIG